MLNNIELHVTFDVAALDLLHLKEHFGASRARLDRYGDAWLQWRRESLPIDAADTDVYERLLDELFDVVKDLRGQLQQEGVSEFSANLHVVIPVAPTTDTQHLYAKLPTKWMRLLAEWDGMCEVYIYQVDEVGP